MISRQHKKHSISAMLFKCCNGCCGNRRCCVSTKGLQDVRHKSFGVTYFAKFIFSFKEKIAIGNSYQAIDILQASSPDKCFLQQALTILQTNKWLGMLKARNWPKPRTCPPRKNDWYQFHPNAPPLPCAPPSQRCVAISAYQTTTIAFANRPYPTPLCREWAVRHVH